MEKSEIRETRIKKEKELLQKNSNLTFKVEFCETSDSLEITTEVHSFVVSFFIDIPEKYPFEPPKVTLNQNPNLTTLTDFEKNEDILEQVLGESWLPVQNLVEVSEKLVLYAQQSFKPKDKAIIIDVFSIKPYWSTISVVLLSLLIRISVIPLPHSGWNSNPWYGEYESYRYWMSVTNKYKVNEWYSQSEDFWPMKNPPLNSFFCWGLSFIGLLADPNSLDELSRGYFSASHKLFMRISVIFLELVFFTIAVITFFNIYYKNLTTGVKSAACAILLITPSLVLITHVLFSYDIVCIGLSLWCIIFIIQDHLAISAVFIGLAWNFKKESFVYMIPLFLAIMIKLYKNTCKKTSSRKTGLRTFFFIAEFGIGLFSILLSLILTFVVIWSPWLNSESELESVFEIIFKPAEDFNPLYPAFFSILHEIFGIGSYKTMIMSCIATSLSSMPFIVLLLTKKPFGLSLIYCLSGVGLSFYIFFYQESLKTILFPLMPLSILVIIDFPEFFRFISVLFTLTLYEASVKDQSLSAYIGLSLFFFIVSSSYIKTVNYFQNRKGVDFKFWYLAAVILHLSQFFVGRWFGLLFNGFVFLSLMFLWGWVLIGHQKITGEMVHQYHVEKRFRKKNKVT